MIRRREPDSAFLCILQIPPALFSFTETVTEHLLHLLRRRQILGLEIQNLVSIPLHQAVDPGKQKRRLAPFPGSKVIPLFIDSEAV